MPADVALIAEFPAQYRFEVLSELPTSAVRRLYFPAGPTGGPCSQWSRDGMLVYVEPEEGEPWIGVFEYGDVRLRGLTAVTTHPNERFLGVVARGAGYLVEARSPEQFLHIQGFPVKEVLTLVSRRLLLFADATELVAFDREGLAWCTDRLAWDEFRILSVSDEETRVTVSYPEEAEGIIDPSTGRHR